jgi:hypothetical protein
MSKDKKVIPRKNLPKNIYCSCCGKPLSDTVVLTEVLLDVYSWYVNNHKKQLENINGLWKKNSEYFCEICFAKYVKAMEKFYKNCRKV